MIVVPWQSDAGRLEETRPNAFYNGDVTFQVGWKNRVKKSHKVASEKISRFTYFLKKDVSVEVSK